MNPCDKGLGLDVCVDHTATWMKGGVLLQRHPTALPLTPTTTSAQIKKY